MGGLTPGEAVVGGVVLYMASDARIRDMAESNGESRFVEGCHGPWFEELVARALLAVGEEVAG